MCQRARLECDTGSEPRPGCGGLAVTCAKMAPSPPGLFPSKSQCSAWGGRALRANGSQKHTERRETDLHLRGVKVNNRARAPAPHLGPSGLRLLQRPHLALGHLPSLEVTTRPALGRPKSLGDPTTKQQRFFSRPRGRAWGGRHAGQADSEVLQLRDAPVQVQGVGVGEGPAMLHGPPRNDLLHGHLHFLAVECVRDALGLQDEAGDVPR